MSLMIIAIRIINNLQNTKISLECQPARRPASSSAGQPASSPAGQPSTQAARQPASQLRRQPASHVEPQPSRSCTSLGRERCRLNVVVAVGTAVSYSLSLYFSIGKRTSASCTVMFLYVVFCILIYLCPYSLIT